MVSGADLEGAIYASEELEETAKIFLLLQNARTNCLNAEQIDELKTAFKLDFGDSAVPSSVNKTEEPGLHAATPRIAR